MLEGGVGARIVWRREGGLRVFVQTQPLHFRGGVFGQFKYTLLLLYELIVEDLSIITPVTADFDVLFRIIIRRACTKMSLAATTTSRDIPLNSKILDFSGVPPRLLVQFSLVDVAQRPGCLFSNFILPCPFVAHPAGPVM